MQSKEKLTKGGMSHIAKFRGLYAGKLLPGVFLKARKPPGFKANDLGAHVLYSIVAKRRCDSPAASPSAPLACARMPSESCCCTL